MIMKKTLQLLGFVLVVALGGACAAPTAGAPTDRSEQETDVTTTAVEPTEDTSAPSAETPAEPGADEPVADEPAGTDAGAVRIGEGVYAYDDGLTIEVVGLAPYEPGEYAYGTDSADSAVTFTVMITNGTTEPVDLALTRINVNAGPAGNAAEQIIDSELAYGFDGAVLPGKASSIQVAFAVDAVDLGELVVEVEPGFLSYDAAYFEGSLG